MHLSRYLYRSDCEHVDRRYDSSAGRFSGSTKQLYFRAVTKRNKYTYTSFDSLQVIDGVPYGLLLSMTNSVRVSSSCGLTCST